VFETAQGQTSTTPPALSGTLLSRRDVQFLLYEWLEVQKLIDRPRFSGHSREVFDDVLQLAEQIAIEEFAPHNRTADAHEPYIGPDGTVVLIPELGEALRAFIAAGLPGATMDEDVGGVQLPHVVGLAATAWLQAANVATTAYPFLTAAAANLLLANGSAEQIDRWARPMIEGRYFGTMCLSETQAGSSLADITTRASRQEDGSYRLRGTKMWISAGDHELSENIVHLVLAKLPDGGPGVKGISLFVVPKFLVQDDGRIGERNDVVLAGLNHKMGFRGTVNTVLGFGEGTYRPRGTAGAVAYLVGEPHRGLDYMFHMMNEARISVGLGATCLGYTAYLKSVRYARERPQGRTVSHKDPTNPQERIISHADVKRMLLAQKSYVEGALALVLFCGKLVDEVHTSPEPERSRIGLLLDVLTPVTKSWPSQWCLKANDLAIQVHGGYGYSREYDVEQHYRDNRLNPIHEGTHGIQGLDLLGRKVRMAGGAGLDALIDAIAAAIRRTAEEEAKTLGEQLSKLANRLIEVTRTVWAVGDAEVSLANATIYLEAVGHIVIAWMWLEQFLAASGRTGDFYDGKRQAARYFFRYELPVVGSQLDLLAAADRTTLEMNEAWF
jgi:alkylation response protein AidB-like acyl-CoA dehydrogenase